MSNRGGQKFWRRAKVLLPKSKPRILGRRIGTVLLFRIIITGFKVTGLDRLPSYNSHSIQYSANVYWTVHHCNS